MDSKKIHAVASEVLEALHNASPVHPHAKSGEPRWYYELATRIALLVGESKIRFVSHTLSDEHEQRSQAWVFTDDAVIVAEFAGTKQKHELAVSAIGRSTLAELSVGYVADAFADSSLPWPNAVSISLRYQNGRSVTLPLEQASHQLEALAELAPSLVRDLNKPFGPSRTT